MIVAILLVAVGCLLVFLLGNLCHWIEKNFGMLPAFITCVVSACLFAWMLLHLIEKYN
jgi:hypothetical protein